MDVKETQSSNSTLNKLQVQKNDKVINPFDDEEGPCVERIEYSLLHLLS